MPRHYEILLTVGAERDIESIYDYISVHDCRASANRVLDQLNEVVASLELFPNRGSHPKELVGLGIREYRQATLKPYRIIYRVIERKVYIHLIADGRRDMQTLLARRLLG